MANPTAPATQAPLQSTGTAAQSGAANAQQQAGKGAPAPGTQAQPSAAEVRRMKLKLEGQEVELPESEVVALAQRGKVADKRFQDAATMKKQAEDILKFATENPAEFFKKTGKNARQWAEEYLMGELKREAMSPEQRKAAENEEKLKKYEDEKKALAEQKRREDLEKMQAEHAKNYDQMFVEALGKSGLPKTPYTIKRMAELQLVNIKKKLELGPDQLAKLVREDYIAEQRALFGQTEGDQLLEILGADIVKKLSKAQIAKLKAKHVTRTSSGQFQGKPREAGAPALSWREYQKRNRGRT